MADRPILFSAPMVRAILREIEHPGTGKTQTRRILKQRIIGNPWFWEGDEVDPDPGWFDGYEEGREPCGAATREVNTPIKLPIAVGDRLWVRETVIGEELHDGLDGVRYVADNAFVPIKKSLNAADEWVCLHSYGWPGGCPELLGKKVPSIHMPKWASRITLIVDGIKVERLQDISEADAKAEGVSDEFTDYELYGQSQPYRFGYSSLWNLINGESAWQANPWVVAYTFRPILGNIDQIGEDNG